MRQPGQLVEIAIAGGAIIARWGNRSELFPSAKNVRETRERETVLAFLYVDVNQISRRKRRQYVLIFFPRARVGGRYKH